MKPIRTLATLLIATLALSSTTFAASSPADLTGLIFKTVKIEAINSPKDVSIEKTVMAELLSRGAVQDPKSTRVLEGKATFAVAPETTWSNAYMRKVSLELSGEGFAFTGEFENTTIMNISTQTMMEVVVKNASSKFAEQLAKRGNGTTRTGAGSPQSR